MFLFTLHPNPRDSFFSCPDPSLNGLVFVSLSLRSPLSSPLSPPSSPPHVLFLPHLSLPSLTLRPLPSLSPSFVRRNLSGSYPYPETLSTPPRDRRYLRGGEKRRGVSVEGPLKSLMRQEFTLFAITGLRLFLISPLLSLFVSVYLSSSVLSALSLDSYFLSVRPTLTLFLSPDPSPGPDSVGRPREGLTGCEWDDGRHVYLLPPLDFHHSRV